MSNFGIPCKKLHEGLGKDELADVGEGKYQILIMSPESFALKEIRSLLLKLQEIVCLAIDEAHCVLQWLVHVLLLFWICMKTKRKFHCSETGGELVKHLATILEACIFEILDKFKPL